MRINKIILVFVLLAFVSTGLHAEAEELSATVEATEVSFGSATQYFRYRYTIASSPTNTRLFDGFELLTPDKPQKRYKGTIINIKQPDGKTSWKGRRSFIKELESNMMAWWAVKANISQWSEIDEPHREALKPGERLDNLGLDSQFLPGAIMFIVEPWKKPPTEEDLVDIINKTKGTNYKDISEVPLNVQDEFIGRGSYLDDTVNGKTVGPLFNPSGKAIAEFLDHLISQKHQAQDLGWISSPGSEGIGKSLDAKLNAAKDSVDRGQNNAARNQLKAFLNEVEAQKDKTLNNNAYLLLKLNAEYILIKLPEK